jgi:hypothetical protein
MPMATLLGRLANVVADLSELDKSASASGREKAWTAGSVWAAVDGEKWAVGRYFLFSLI